GEEAQGQGAGFGGAGRGLGRRGRGLLWVGGSEGEELPVELLRGGAGCLLVTSRRCSVGRWDAQRPEQLRTHFRRQLGGRFPLRGLLGRRGDCGGGLLAFVVDTHDGRVGDGALRDRVAGEGESGR